MNRRLTIMEKKRVLEMMEKPRMTQRIVAKEFGVTPKTIRNLLCQKNEITKLSSNPAASKQFHCIVDQKFKAINEATYSWFTQMREKHGNIPIVESVVREKATEFAAILGVTDFKASNGWFRSWKSRSNIESYKVSDSFQLEIWANVLHVVGH